jgi:acetate kinase
MAILVINAGGSSVKLTLFGPDGETVWASGIVERIGFDGTRLKYRNRTGQNLDRLVPVRNADEAVGTILAALTHTDHGASSLASLRRDASKLGGMKYWDKLLLPCATGREALPF